MATNKPRVRRARRPVPELHQQDRDTARVSRGGPGYGGYYGRHGEDGGHRFGASFVGGQAPADADKESTMVKATASSRTPSKSGQTKKTNRNKRADASLTSRPPRRGTGLGTPLQPGGTQPSSGPGAGMGSLGSGGGSTAGRATGSVRKRGR